jgi:uncharacterized protein YecT (DUF1311 family)
MSKVVHVALVVLLFAGISSAPQDSNHESPAKKQLDPCEGQQLDQRQMNDCYDTQYQKAEKRLIASYEKILKSMQDDLAKDRHKNIEELPKHDEMAIQKLRAAQTAWVAYRRLHCEAAEFEFENGSISPTIYAACMEATTNDRIDELRKAYEYRDK